MKDWRSTLQRLLRGNGERSEGHTSLNSEWADPEVEGHRNWHGARGRTPLDVLRSYLERRSAWDVASARSSAGPGEPGWGKLQDELMAIHGDLSTPKPLSARDTSGGVPPTRDPARTRVTAVVWIASDTVRITTEEDDPLGIIGPEVYQVTAKLLEGDWRLDDRVLVKDDGKHLRGLL